jgi:hypothetical protein
MTEATILSNESKDKQLDTFKAHFTNKDGVKTEAGGRNATSVYRFKGKNHLLTLN